MKILITGINGFVGTNLAKNFIEDNHQIIGMYRSNVDKTKLSSFKKKQIKYIHYLDLHKVKEIDVVIHAASDIDFSDEATFNKNLIYLFKLINFIKKINCKKFIFLSSGEVSKLFQNYQNLDENLEYLSNSKFINAFTNKYQMLKFFSEKILLDLSNNTHFKINIIRINSLIGNNLPKNYIFHKIFISIFKNKPLTIKNPDIFRTYAHTDDLYELINLCISKKMKKIIFLGGYTTSIKELVKIIMKQNF